MLTIKYAFPKFLSNNSKYLLPPFTARSLYYTTLRKLSNNMAQQEFKIPEKQWAQVFDKHNGPIELKQIPVPKPGPDQILINIKYTGGSNCLAVFLLD
jgi:hypothetical protein